VNRRSFLKVICAAIAAPFLAKAKIAQPIEPAQNDKVLISAFPSITIPKDSIATDCVFAFDDEPDGHASDCAVHNVPFMPNLPCNFRCEYTDPEIVMACHGTDEETVGFTGASTSILIRAECSLDNGETWKTLDISGDNSVRPYWELTLLKGAGDNINDNT
jgi:hypothetical protein